MQHARYCSCTLAEHHEDSAATVPGYIHHLQWSVASVEAAVTSLTRHWGGRRVASRRGEVVIQLGRATILVSEKQIKNGHSGEELERSV